jgi:hypothetical protein
VDLALGQLGPGPKGPGQVRVGADQVHSVKKLAAANLINSHCQSGNLQCISS